MVDRHRRGLSDGALSALTRTAPNWQAVDFSTTAWRWADWNRRLPRCELDPGHFLTCTNSENTCSEAQRVSADRFKSHPVSRRSRTDRVGEVKIALPYSFRAPRVMPEWIGRSDRSLQLQAPKILITRIQHAHLERVTYSYVHPTPSARRGASISWRRSSQSKDTIWTPDRGGAATFFFLA